MKLLGGLVALLIAMSCSSAFSSQKHLSSEEILAIHFILIVNDQYDLSAELSSGTNLAASKLQKFAKVAYQSKIYSFKNLVGAVRAYLRKKNPTHLSPENLIPADILPQDRSFVFVGPKNDTDIPVTSWDQLANADNAKNYWVNYSSQGDLIRNFLAYTFAKLFNGCEWTQDRSLFGQAKSLLLKTKGGGSRDSKAASEVSLCRTSLLQIVADSSFLLFKSSLKSIFPLETEHTLEEYNTSTSTLGIRG